MRAACGWLPVADREVIGAYGSLACGVTVAVLWLGLWAVARWRGFSSLSGRAGKFACAAFSLNLLPLLIEVIAALTLPEEQVNTGHFCEGRASTVGHGVRLMRAAWRP